MCPDGVLSASGLVEVGQQPAGALSGRIVYAHAGHGWTADNLDTGSWTTQRGELHEIVEDLGNQDQLTFFADYLFRAGATVVPLRPVGHQTNEVILDNVDPGVTFSGSWVDSTAGIYFGEAGETPDRCTSTSPTETAYARYRPNIPEAGHYPVYAWTGYGSDRAFDQLYRIHHTGGTTEVTVNHQRVGNGPVYLGTYYFGSGTDSYVDISNRSADVGKVVIADMVRFGNGIGDIDRGGGISGKSREDEAGLYWVMWHVDRSQGIPTSEYRASTEDRSATVSLSPRYAEYMNRETDGSLTDRVFISFHSNGGGGTARGVLSLYNGNNYPSSATPNQYLLANLTGREVNDDLVAQAGQFEHNWYERTVVTLDRSDIEFGEINNNYINDEFDATIVETGFHDNQEDAEMLRDPRVRDALARATYQGVVRYFNNVDGGVTPLVMLPGQVTDVQAGSSGVGSVTVSWTPPPANAYNGDAATGYRVYMSLDGYGFDGGTPVAGGATSTHTFTGLDPSAGVHYFRIAAINSGGESKPSEVVAALPNAGNANILIVNGFDRFDRRLNPRQPYFSGAVDRVWPRHNNSFDYVVQVAEAIEAHSPALTIDSTSNEEVISGDVDLTDYDHVFWILGEESTADDTFDATEQSLVTAFLHGGGNVFVSGAEIGWDLDNLNNGRAFYENELHGDYVSDDANTYNVSGTASGFLHDLSFSFDNGSIFYDANYPDVISPLGGAVAAASYVGGTGGTAATQFDGGGTNGSVVMLGFPFETITAPTARNAVMARVLEFFSTSETLLTVLNTNDSGPGSLRQVVAEASSGARVTFTNTLSGQTILLTSGQIPVTNNLVIDASALPDAVAIDGNGNSRIFSFASGTTNVLTGLTLTNGYTSDKGGSIYLNSIAVLTINDCTVSGNSADARGGGIYSMGTLILADSTLSCNNTAEFGGGIYSGDMLTLTHATLSGNTAEFGGGIHFVAGTLTLHNTTLSGNSADSHGGGIYNESGTLTLSNSTLSSNTAIAAFGAGIYNFHGTLTLNNATLNGNYAAYLGGGIFIDEGLVMLNNSTLSGNTAEFDGGGIYKHHGTLTLTNTIVAGNTAPSSANIFGSLTGTHNLTNGVPMLVPLGDYGGPTQTMPPLPSSPAIDAGSTTSLSADQRGFTRVFNGTADIGAVEFQGAGDVARFWSTDWDGDGSPFCMEFAMGTDPLVAEPDTAGRLTPYPPFRGHGARLGFNPVASNYTAWVLNRSLDLDDEPFFEVYRFDGPTGDAITSSVPVTVNVSSNIMQITDETIPHPPAAFYQLQIEQSP